MLFGRGGKAEEVGVDALAELLNSIFNKKMSSLESKGASITKELQSAKGQFIEFCARLGKLEVEPYTEGLWSFNINSIKTQKVGYAHQLQHIAEELNLDVDIQNVYARYKQLLANVEEMDNRVLTTNAKYKEIMYCYSYHLADLKRSFTTIEKLMQTLKGELDRRIDDFDTCGMIMQNISTLSLKNEELVAALEGVKMLKENIGTGKVVEVDKNEAEALERLFEKKDEILKIDGEVHHLMVKIESLTAPLDRASKKLDHIHTRKRPLNTFIMDPMGNMHSQTDYEEFRSLVQELEKEVASGAVEVKNGEVVMSAISMLLNSDIYYMIDSRRSLQQKKSGLEGELKILERLHDELRKGKENKTKSAQEIARMESEIESITKSQISLKAAIEKGFQDYYGKTIVVII
ncbi:MAG: hypothetical protein ACREBF_03780 [Candidatus Micrarchaeales archaeon]